MGNGGVAIPLYFFETLSLLYFIALSVICGLINPISFTITIPSIILHILVFVLNIVKKYKYYIVSIITKILFGISIPPLLLIFVDYSFILMVVNSFLFMMSLTMTGVSRTIHQKQAHQIYVNPYAHQVAMTNPPNFVYVQPQQPYYAIPPNMPKNVPMVQAYNPYGQNIPQYYPPQTQQFQEASVIDNGDKDAPLPSINMVQGGESINQVDKPN